MREIDSNSRLSRLDIALFDFREARDFAEYILRERLHDVKSSIAKAKLAHRAFNTSMIVSYIRPFQGNDEPDGTKVRLSAVAISLNETERVLHEEVRNKRNKVFAHSEWLSHEFEGINFDGLIRIYKPASDPLTIEKTELLLGMIGKWIKHIKSLRVTAKQQ